MNKIRSLLTTLNLHLAGLAVIVLLNIFFGVRVILAMHAIRSDESQAFTTEEIHYGQLQAKMSQVHDLPAKVSSARLQEQQFLDARIAPNYSTIAAELGDVAAKENVRLANAQYTPTPAVAGITRVQIDASMSGQYAPLMHFINDLERDQHGVFFIITGLAFNGQQGGLVNLRIRIDTYLRSDASDIPASSATPASPSSNSGSSSDTANTSARLRYPLDNQRTGLTSAEVR